MDEARRIIERLGLEPHPEGGWYRETWRAEAAPGARSAGTAIHFLLEPGQSSHWHRIDAPELWIFQTGSALELRTAGKGPAETVRLGADVLAGDAPQHLVRAGEWQAATARDGWALVACVVIPGFDFASFELAPPGWAPEG